MEPALELNGIAKLYGATIALRATSLKLEQGQALALLGPNGSGKTTLLKIVAGAMTPTLGAGTVYGSPLRGGAAKRRDVGVLAAETYLYDDLTALENLRFIATMAGIKSSRPEMEAAIAEVGLANQADVRVRRFSSGMKQRLALARLQILRPRLLLLDEPYNSLDERGADLVDAMVRAHVGAGGAVVLVTHDARRALDTCDLAMVLERGAVTYLGPARGYRTPHEQHVG